MLEKKENLLALMENSSYHVEYYKVYHLKYLQEYPYEDESEEEFDIIAFIKESILDIEFDGEYYNLYDYDGVLVSSIIFEE